jgi:predicted AAA+ superfamily ATPase
MGRFWSMLAHGHGQLLNAAELGRSFGIVATTVKSYVDILQSTFMVRLLSPWHTNGTKREVKSPKFYLRDTGLLHTLLQIDSWQSLNRHPILGASWEGYALEQVIALLPDGTRPYFWATHAGAELDLYFECRGKAFGVEFKYTDAPARTRSMTMARESLGLEQLWVVCPEGRARSLGEGMEVLPIAAIGRIEERLKG